MQNIQTKSEQMGHFNDHLHVRIIVNVILLGVEIAGDQIPNSQFMSREIRLTLDNGVHGLIAALTWLIVIDYRQDRIYRNIYEVLLCGALGSIVDLDHFLEARSFHLEDALNLTRRPVFHNTLLLLLVWNILILLSTLLTSKNMWRFSWIILTAGLSHHFRDGIKHGLLMDPLGSTAVLPYWSYVLATALLPYIIRLAIINLKMPRHENTGQSLDIRATIDEKNEKF